MVSSTTTAEGAAISPYVYYNGAYRRIPVYEQSVSIVATIDRGDQDQNSQSLILSLGLTKDDLPVVIGVSVGAMLLVTIIIVLLICTCVKHRRSRKDHHVYRIQSNPTFHAELKQDNNNEFSQSDTVVVVTGNYTSGVPYESYVVDNMKTSASKSDFQVKPNFEISSDFKQAGKVRPLSQPVNVAKVDIHNITEKFEENVINYMNEEEMKSPVTPKQKAAQSCEFLDLTSDAFYNSTEDLDIEETYTRERSGTMEQMLRVNAATKSRSLPNWGRLRPRPLSTTDDIRELRAKVNYTKKRKNRMKNDCAAAIALTKSRTNILTFNDTESLVDNEAVVVYDERTAL